jgi:Arc-like DNA binding domain
MKKKPKTKVVAARLCRETMDKLKAAAKKSGRSLFQEFVVRIEQSFAREK